MANVKQVKIGTTAYDVEALHFVTGSLDTPQQWKDYIDNLVGQGLQIVTDDPATSGQEPKTAASASTMGKLYLVQFSGQTESGTYTEFVTIDKGTGDPRYVWEKIGTTAADLTEYLKKDTNYSAAAKSAGGHTHTVTVPTVSVDTTKKLGASATGTAVAGDGTVNAVTSYPGASSKLVTTTITGVSGSDIASKATAGIAFNAVKSVSISGGTESGTGKVAYISAVAAPTLDGTTNFNTDAIKDITLSASDTSTDGPAYVSGVSGSFNTDAIKNVKLSGSTSTSTGAVTYVEAISGSAPTLTGTKTFATGGMTASVSDGVLTFAAAGTGTVGISGGSYSSTTKYLTGSGDAATKASVGSTTKYMKHANTAAAKASVTISGGTGTTQYLSVSAPTQSVTPYTFTDVTVPQAAASATTVATGSLNANGSGAAVMTGLGTAVTKAVLTGVKVTANPTITITESASNKGPVNEHTTVTSNSAPTSTDGAHVHNVKVNA